MAFKNHELALIADLLMSLDLGFARITIGDGPEPLEALTVQLNNVFDGEDIVVRLIPLEQLDRISPSEPADDPDADPELSMLRMDAALPVPYKPERLEEITTCLDVVNSVLPFGAVVIHPLERSIAFHYTVISNSVVFDAHLVIDLLRSLEFYFAMMAKPLREAIQGNMGAQEIREAVLAFVQGLYAPGTWERAP
jgi:hypothetical protein